MYQTLEQGGRIVEWEVKFFHFGYMSEHRILIGQFVLVTPSLLQVLRFNFPF